MALIFVMIDGVGLAPASPYNPVAYGLPRLVRALGAPLTDALRIDTPEVYAKPIDATLGVAGLPQSGSGHSAIYGGFNAPALNGRHQPSYPTIAMRQRLADQNMLQVARQAGYCVAWVNAYLPGYRQAVEQRRMRHTAGTWAALYAGLALRDLSHLMAGTAVSWDITQHLARMRPGAEELPLIPPEIAGARLATLARTHNLVAFETYLPDLAAHRRLDLSVQAALATIDGLLAGILAHCAADDTLVITSDHGNSEDATTRLHTRNPVPLLAIGPAAACLRQVEAIDEVAAALLAGLNKETQCTP